MFNVGDIVYISEYANPTQLDHSKTLRPGDGPFTVLRFIPEVANSDNVLNVYLQEVGWWVSVRALILEADMKNPKSKLERKIALIYKRYEERNM